MWKSSWDPHTSHVDPLWTLPSCLPITYWIRAGFALTRARWFFLYLTRSPEESPSESEGNAGTMRKSHPFVLRPRFLAQKLSLQCHPWEWVFTTLFLRGADFRFSPAQSLVGIRSAVPGRCTPRAGRPGDRGFFRRPPTPGAGVVECRVRGRTMRRWSGRLRVSLALLDSVRFFRV